MFETLGSHYSYEHAEWIAPGSFCMHDDFVGVAWAWTMLSEFFAHPNGSKFPLGQRGQDSRGWTVTPKLQKNDHSNDLNKLIRMLQCTKLVYFWWMFLVAMD